MGNWLEERFKQASDEELFAIFTEIAEFHREGVLRPDAKLRDIEWGYRAVVCTTSSLLRTVEDQALFEMSRRFSAGVESGKHCGAISRSTRLTLDELGCMDGKPVWCEDTNHYGLICVTDDCRWPGVPFLYWKEGEARFEFNIKNRDLHIYRCLPAGVGESAPTKI